jgi:gamma-glutamylcyclotransferase (GGCT)/AIG2-like uncharacterized protein YtfP
MEDTSPQQPPPLPPQGQKPPETLMKLRSKISPFIRKLQSAPNGYWFEPKELQDPIDPLAPCVGPYFFYGTLMDPSLLSEILALPEKPRLRPAKLTGYSLKLWGQYPALVDGATGEVVEGMAYDVESEQHAEKLAAYETRAYRSAPCRIRFMDGGEPGDISGTTFQYAGNPMDITEGKFDLGVWLRRMGRDGAGNQ